MKKLLILLLLTATVASVAWAKVITDRYRQDALRADSLAAVADTARLLALEALGDSTRAYQLRIVQTELQRDSVEQELRQRPVIRVAAGLRVDTLRILDTVPVVRQDTVRIYAFGGLDGPFRFDGDARILPDDRGIFGVRVTLERPIPVSARITCGSRGAGIHSASLLLTADDPFSLIPETVFQDPEICNPSVPAFRFSKGKALWAGIGFLGGVLIANLVDDGFRRAWY